MDDTRTRVTPTAERDRSLIERDLAYALATQVFELRRAAGLSQSELAARAGMKQAHVSRFESAQSTPTLSTLLRLADGLGMTLTVDFTTEETP
ncbi:helix-turn-helix domain-containing protein (plasmid) [Streptomyces sp. NBC_00513]|uniref:helix-turn-helix domain-containing protein n=1 Tax=unclassified Streptomyces TaxID=2593676 RepID=UPI00225BAE63|nr:helix-turn-helix transcriptional regulator [Streptomyces sp. NBC_00424]MCX5078761.1 helix-turn-helix domain-containing protein [Streptomyces sp. NBC_00424]WUD46317.1 helix-turn-helix domain-containing protein [Streptomyces sp. NBC_00513]